MNHAPEYIETMRKLAPLIREHRYFSVWKFDMLCDWCAYHWNRGTISYVIDDWDRARGVCLIKLFSRLEQFLEPFVHEPCGRFCMVDLMAVTDPEAPQLMFDDLYKKWGKQEVVMWDRGDRTESGAPRMYTWDGYRKLLRRITNTEARIR